MFNRMCRRRARSKAALQGVAAGTTVVALMVTGCGGSQGGSGTAPAGMPSSFMVMMFGQPRENPYFGQNAVGAGDVAKKYGWDLTYVESSTQEEQDSAIQQMLAKGDKPIGVLLNPVSGAAAVASEQSIKAAGIPLVVLNQVPSKEQTQLFDAYAGVNDYLSTQRVVAESTPSAHPATLALNTRQSSPTTT
jgi:ABC-type sugar transport system substrate-binding protein